jgi:hypothetical protein
MLYVRMFANLKQLGTDINVGSLNKVIIKKAGTWHSPSLCLISRMISAKGQIKFANNLLA